MWNFCVCGRLVWKWRVLQLSWGGKLWLICNNFVLMTNPYKNNIISYNLPSKKNYRWLWVRGLIRKWWVCKYFHIIVTALCFCRNCEAICASLPFNAFGVSLCYLFAFYTKMFFSMFFFLYGFISWNLVFFLSKPSFFGSWFIFSLSLSFLDPCITFSNNRCSRLPWLLTNWIILF